MSQITFIALTSVWQRGLLIVIALVAVLLSVYAGRQYAGGFLAESAPYLATGGQSAAQTATDFAPRDPQTHWALGTILKRDGLTPTEWNAAAREYELSAALAPHDYRTWNYLGQIHEQIDDAAGAERAFKHARALAPNYAQTRWRFGNFLLRQGRNAEAFAELQAAARSDDALRPQIINTAWAVTRGNLDAMQAAVGNDARGRAELAAFLAAQGNSAAAIKLWSGLGMEEKQAARAQGEAALKNLLTTGKYHAALDFARDLATNGESAPVAGQITDGGFESEKSTGIFGWQIKSVPEAQPGLDGAQRHGGARSLRVQFRAANNFQMQTAAQLVAVEPGARYRVTFFARAENLKSAGLPVWKIATADGRELAVSPAVDTKASDWQSFSFEFKTDAQTEGVRLHLARASCGADETAACPIYGLVWYDDISFQRL